MTEADVVETCDTTQHFVLDDHVRGRARVEGVGAGGGGRGRGEGEGGGLRSGRV